MAKDKDLPDVTLSDGREIRFDMRRVSITEWRSLIKPDQPAEFGDEILGRVSGLTLEEVGALNVYDWRLLCERMFAKFREPLANPT